MRLRSRFTVLFAVLSAVTALFLIVVLDGTLRRAVEDRVTERIEREIDHLTDDLQRAAGGTTKELDAFLRKAARDLACRITVIAADGRVTHDTDLLPADVPQMENDANRPEIQEARQGVSGRARRFSANELEERLYFARRLPTSDFLRLSVAAVEVQQVERGYLWSARLAICLSCLLLFLIGSAASRRFAEPIAELTRAASAVAAGEHGRDLPRAGGEEVQLLAAALQRMKDSLARSAERAEVERRLAAMVFEQLPDGLVVVDSKLHVLESNARFSQMIGVATPAGRALYDLLRQRSLYEVFETTLETGETTERVVRLPGDMVWEVTVVRLPEGFRAAAVGVLRDITLLERTEAMRRTFVADVSHELRTPIASIAAASETLSEGGADATETAHLLGLIRRQSDRMRELIDDLMDLAQIESGAVELREEDISVPSLLREVASELSPAAAEKGVEIVVESEGLAALRGDRRRLGQIVRNLLDNAVKFSPEAAPVILEGRREAGQVVLSVTDRGVGIPKSEQEKIFQRFYQVDRSRSKSRPGTGLGLAIVKHLVHLHRGLVEVESEAGRGSTFRVRLPAD
jgi:two-component system, OmpR family, phosphate regulon sensor histidine kinase PhoR